MEGARSAQLDLTQSKILLLVEAVTGKVIHLKYKCKNIFCSARKSVRRIAPTYDATGQPGSGIASYQRLAIVPSTEIVRIGVNH
jgi:hypothetical protein